MAGAHLDSVPRGPGINDNGSGSARAARDRRAAGARLKTPEQRCASPGGAPRRAGLVGSTYYVNSLSRRPSSPASRCTSTSTWSARRTTACSSTTATVRASAWSARTGSTTIEALFERLLRRARHSVRPTPFSGRSDYQAFINNGIPAGGLFTGAEVLKTAEQAAKWGGTAGPRVRPLLPLGLRHDRQPQPRGARHQLRRGRVRVLPVRIRRRGDQQPVTRGPGLGWLSASRARAAPASYPTAGWVLELWSEPGLRHRLLR